MPYKLTPEEKKLLAQRFPGKKLTKNQAAEMIVVEAMQCGSDLRDGLIAMGQTLTRKQGASILRALIHLSGTVAINFSRLHGEEYDDSEVTDLTMTDLDKKALEVHAQIQKAAAMMGAKSSN